jgi:O-6-methylguanine DNA methyltransferase
MNKSSENYKLLKSFEFNTPLGPTIAISDDEVLYFLGFADTRNIGSAIEKLRISLNADIIISQTSIISLVQAQINAYFASKLIQFTIPIKLIGTPFQKAVWQELMNVKYGTTSSYAAQSAMINHPLAYRAVANANGRNPLSIIVPCHRIINSNGKLGGYNSGLDKKIWLLEHEKKYAKSN